MLIQGKNGFLDLRPKGRGKKGVDGGGGLRNFSYFDLRT